jgi:hypothetical protein
VRASFLFGLLTMMVWACSGDPRQVKEAPRPMDSVSRVRQKVMTDSLKRRNPLLILPPDSDYTGSYVDRYPNGIVKFTGFFRFGKRHGQWMSFFQNGIKWSEMHYDNGRRDGPNQVYYPTGKLLYSGMYKNDMQDSIWDYYDSTGALQQKIKYSAGKVSARVPAK